MPDKKLDPHAKVKPGDYYYLNPHKRLAALRAEKKAGGKKKPKKAGGGLRLLMDYAARGRGIDTK